MLKSWSSFQQVGWCRTRLKLREHFIYNRDERRNTSKYVEKSVSKQSKQASIYLTTLCPVDVWYSLNWLLYVCSKLWWRLYINEKEKSKSSLACKRRRVCLIKKIKIQCKWNSKYLWEKEIHRWKVIRDLNKII